MALPSSTETERTLCLQKILYETPPDAIGQWPMPTKDDFAVIGTFIVLFSHIDLHLWRLVEILELGKALDPALEGKTARMPIGKVEDTILKVLDWSPENRRALQEIKELRKACNLTAHFAVRRFPTEDAFLCITKSAVDCRRTLGFEPDPHVIMTAVADAENLRYNAKTLQGIANWLAVVTSEIAARYLGSKPDVAE